MWIAPHYLNFAIFFWLYRKGVLSPSNRPSSPTHTPRDAHEKSQRPNPAFLPQFSPSHQHGLGSAWCLLIRGWPLDKCAVHGARQSLPERESSCQLLRRQHCGVKATDKGEGRGGCWPGPRAWGPAGEPTRAWTPHPWVPRLMSSINQLRQGRYQTEL